MHRLDMNHLPRHVAVIMDGNGRWAKSRNQERVYGHRAGVKAVRETVTATRELGIPHLTLFALSSENLNRPQYEIDALMMLFHQYLDEELGEMLENGIGFEPIGRWRDLRPDVVEHINQTVEKTSHCKDMTLHLALNYGGRAEIIDACNKLIESAVAGNLKGKIDEKLFSRYLYTAEIPDPDLLIRTSGEIRVSNFLLWQIAYCEIFFTPVLWPDFQREHLYEAIADYQRRERRFGLTGDQLKAAKEKAGS
jgi:undecaprenyl diphosphate synthase